MVLRFFSFYDKSDVEQSNSLTDTLSHPLDNTSQPRPTPIVTAATSDSSTSSGSGGMPIAVSWVPATSRITSDPRRSQPAAEVYNHHPTRPPFLLSSSGSGRDGAAAVGALSGRPRGLDHAPADPLPTYARVLMTSPREQEEDTLTKIRNLGTFGFQNLD